MSISFHFPITYQKKSKLTDLPIQSQPNPRYSTVHLTGTFIFLHTQPFFLLLDSCWDWSKNGFPASKHLQWPQSYQTFRAQLQGQFFHKAFPSHRPSIQSSPWICRARVLAFPAQPITSGWMQCYIPYCIIKHRRTGTMFYSVLNTLPSPPNG